MDVLLLCERTIFTANMQDMQILHFSFCCTAHIFRTSKKRNKSRNCSGNIPERRLSMFEVLKTRVTAWKRYNRTVSELNALSNRELSDLGIARSDIQRVARQAAR